MIILIITDILKLAYHDGRPFWVGSNVRAYACESQFGNPSGHSTMAMGMSLTIWLDLYTS